METADSIPEFKTFLMKGEAPHEVKGLSVSADGQAVTVRSDWNNRIFQQVRESSPVREVASVMETGSNSLEVLVDRQEPQAEWVGELDARNKTTASYVTRQLIPVHESYALPEVTQQLLEDSQFDVEQWLQGKVASRFYRMESNAFINGDGVGKPRGILNYGTTPEASHTWAADPDAYTLGATYTGEAGDLTNPDTLFDLVDSLKTPYLPGAAWMMSRALRNRVRLLKDAQGRFLFEPALSAGVPDTLLGYPVYLSEDLPGLVTDEIGAIFGNWSEGYTIVDRVGITVQRDQFTKPGWVKYYARRRVGGAVTNPEALKVLVLGTEPA